MNLDVDISLKQGRFLLAAEFRCTDSAFGIFGPSGCGKTTLFRALAGLARPDGGHIILNGEPLFDADRHLFVPPHKREIGLVFQEARLFPHWSVEQNLRAGECLKHRVASRPYGFDDIVDLLNIQHLIGRSVELLSGGEKARIAMGRTLLAHPRLLLMDEPVAGLDVSLKRQILPFLAKVHEALKIPAILISHNLDQILQFTDRILLMRNGSVVGNNRLDQLVQDPETLQELKGAELTNLLKLRVRNHDKARGTTTLDLPDAPAELAIEMEWCPDFPPGQHIHIGVAANHIALATTKIEAISIRNQFPGRVKKIIHTPGRSICLLDTSFGTLFAEITPGTEQDMKLKAGAGVWILFKSHSIHSM